MAGDDMSGLRLEGVGKSFGAVAAVRDVDVDFPHGRFVCLLGPSGCGKTTLLRLVAGLEEPTTGRILLDGADLTRIPAHKRGFGMVFQSLALFPHLTVGGNIAYGLAVQGVDKAQRRRRTEELLELVHLPGVAGRPISQLSGGQKQRVAIARALALDPRLFLLDEPLSALDAKLREAMQVELRQLQRRLGISTILVTHDQREAMTMADIVVIMEQGRVQQVAPPLEIYRSPANAFVADFIGSSNLIPGRLAESGTVMVEDRRLQVESVPDGVAPGAAITLSVRPEEVHIRPMDEIRGDERPAGETGANRLPGVVAFIRDLGASVEITARCGGIDIRAVTSPRERPAVEMDEAVSVELPAAACVVLAS